MYKFFVKNIYGVKCYYWHYGLFEFVKVDRLKVRSIFLSSQPRQTPLVVSPGCIGECVLSGKTCHSNFLSCQTYGLKVYQSLPRLFTFGHFSLEVLNFKLNGFNFCLGLFSGLFNCISFFCFFFQQIQRFLEKKNSIDYTFIEFFVLYFWYLTS